MGKKLRKEFNEFEERQAEFNQSILIRIKKLEDANNTYIEVIV